MNMNLACSVALLLAAQISGTTLAESGSVATDPVTIPLGSEPRLSRDEHTPGTADRSPAEKNTSAQNCDQQVRMGAYKTAEECLTTEGARTSRRLKNGVDSTAR